MHTRYCGMFFGFSNYLNRSRAFWRTLVYPSTRHKVPAAHPRSLLGSTSPPSSFLLLLPCYVVLAPSMLLLFSALFSFSLATSSLSLYICSYFSCFFSPVLSLQIVLSCSFSFTLFASIVFCFSLPLFLFSLFFLLFLFSTLPFLPSHLSDSKLLLSFAMPSSL